MKRQPQFLFLLDKFNEVRDELTFNASANDDAPLSPILFIVTIVGEIRKRVDIIITQDTIR